jgi:hypothetical protein
MEATMTQGKHGGRAEAIRAWLTTVGLLISALSLAVAAYGIRENHEWNRRHFAAEMMREWNTSSSQHKVAIESAYPEFYQKEADELSRARMSPEEAKKVYTSTPKDSLRWETRNHCIALLNYFEYVTAAYEKNVADRNIIEDSFQPTILRWHHDLEEFISIMQKIRGYHPWPPLQRTVAKWKAEEEGRQDKPKTGTVVP